MWEICSFEFNNKITVCYQNICHFKFFYNKDSDTKGYFVMGRKKLKKKNIKLSFSVGNVNVAFPFKSGVVWGT